MTIKTTDYEKGPQKTKVRGITTGRLKMGKGIEERDQTKGGINRRERRRERQDSIVKGDEGREKRKRGRRER